MPQIKGKHLVFTKINVKEIQRRLKREVSDLELLSASPGVQSPFESTS